jgi:uncharacterized protein
MAALAPGVYVQSVPSGVHVVAAAGTSVAAFLGVADLENQPADTPIPVANWQDFLTKFVATLNPAPPAAPAATTPAATTPAATNPATTPPAAAPTPTPAPATPAPPPTPPLLADAVFGWFANGGGPCYVVRIGAAETSLAAALTSLEGQPDVTIVAAPGMSDVTGIQPANWQAEQQRMAGHCQTMGNRVALLDLPLGTPAQGNTAAAPPTSGAGDLAAGLNLAGDVASFAVVYYPWLTARSVYTSVTQPRSVPPSGHVAGAWARTDATRGVHKAPANVAIQGIQGLEVMLTDALQAPLNDKAVNCIRTFPGQGTLVWGARTLAARNANEIDFKYVNVRRFISFLTDSVKQSTRWAVFEPNNALLQAKVAGSVSSFLTDQWRLGALVGATPAQAFYVICDSRNNTTVSMAQGDLTCDIGVAPARPAEFVHFRITQTYS